MKSKKWLPLIFLLVIPLVFAYEEQNLNYDSTQNNIKIGYDNLNRIVQKNSSSEIINYSYDKQLQGTLNNISFGNSTYRYTYDDKLRVIEEKIVIDGIEFTKTYVYDSNDRLVSQMFNGQDLDYYYNQMGKLDKINGFINKTNYNVLGSPLNRTYFNGKITAFDYYTNNLRLRQIKTDTIQQLNYTYDNVGNIIGINDSVNNRTYSMTYDNLDRLTNVTISGFSWIYSYDAIGRILKVVRNSSQTTSMKYDLNPVHAPSKVITTDTGIDVYRPNIYNTSNRTQIVQFYLLNEKNTSLSIVNYSVAFGDNYVFNSTNLSLALKGFTLVSVERNYTTGGNYLINITARANTTATDFEQLKLLFGTLANGLSILKQNGSLVVVEFDAQNTITDISQNWGFNCSHSLISNVSFNMSSNQNLMIIIEHNFTTIPSTNLTCRVNSTDGNQSIKLPFNFDNIKIENYNSSVLDSDTILVKFNIKNYYSTLNNINWTITADTLTYNASGISLSQGQSTTISQELNFTNAGTKQIKIIINSGNFTDSYSENIRWYSLGIQQYINYIKNGTTRIFNFIVKNDWISIKAKFNITDPRLENTTTLVNNESIIVVIEENYGQGKKDVTVNAMNSSSLEDIELDVFSIKHIGINKFETLHENSSRAVTNALVINNINPLNLSWRLNNTEALITSTQNLELNTSQQAFVVIESNFSTSGIYPLNFLINSSAFNDNQTGVAVS